MNNLTSLLHRANGGRSGVNDQLLAVVYDELRYEALRQLEREKPGHTLQATALVHEAYIRLLGPPNPEKEPLNWNSRGHFFAAAAEAMRRILVEQARRKKAQKRGGDWGRADIEVDRLSGKKHDEKMLSLDEALRKLEVEDEVKAHVVKLRFFAGMTIEQTAAALDVGTSTVDRYWTYARAWLHREMKE